MSSAAAAAGVPPKPDAAHQAIYLAALKAVDPTLAADPDKAVREGRNQCSTLNGGGDPTGHTAATRFGNDVHPLTDTQGMAINAALQTAVCPKS
jgi:type IV secretory pathway VirB10-like protein